MSSMSIIICWFGAQEMFIVMLKTFVLLNIFVESIYLKQELVTFDQWNDSLLNTIIAFFITDNNLSNSRYYKNVYKDS